MNSNKIEIKNTSGRYPQGVAVLVKPYETQRKDSKIILPETVKDRSKMLEDKAIVIEIGSEAWSSESRPRAKIGDHVMIGKFAGLYIQGKDGEFYRVVNSGDIYMTIDPEQ